jgi:preprotein translocase subunit SecG
MSEVIIVIHLLLVLALVVVVLLQKSEGGGLGMGGGGNTGGFMTSRGTANVLSRTTALLALGFFITSMVLSILATNNRQPRSILDQRPAAAGAPVVPAVPGGPTAPATGGGGVLDQLQQLRQQTAPPAGQPAPAPGPAPAQ